MGEVNPYMKVFIRSDANSRIGMGHIMRCLSMADAFASAGGQVSFVLADDGAGSLVKQRGYETVVLDTDYRDMEAELPRWPSAGQDVLLVDSYHVTDAYLEQLRNRCGKLIYIDDLASFPYPVDMVVNYNAYGPYTDYLSLYGKAGKNVPKLILGPAYAPLRTMFRGVPKKEQPEQVQNVLISTGGADELHLAVSLLRALNEGEDKGYVFHFLVGAMNADRQEIRDLAKGRSRIVIHENVSDMRELLEKMDLAVSAAGSTLYEICACGVPLITFSMADNQIPGAEAFGNLGLACNIGDLREPRHKSEGELPAADKLKAGIAGTVISAIREIAGNREIRCETGDRMQRLIDGYGADRIIGEVLLYSR